MGPTLKSLERRKKQVKVIKLIEREVSKGAHWQTRPGKFRDSESSAARLPSRTKFDGDVPQFLRLICEGFEVIRRGPRGRRGLGPRRRPPSGMVRRQA